MTNYQLARQWMQDNCADYYDGIVINCTHMTEDCADALDIYDDEEYTTPEWLYELAVEVEAWYLGDDDDESED